MNEGDVVDALVSAYNHQKFIEMLRLRMGVNLEDIATGDNYREIVFKTVRHYADISPAALWHMVVQAALGNPQNEELGALVEQMPLATQSRRGSGGGSPMISRRENTYGEDEFSVLSNLVSELSKQVQKLETTFGRWEVAAKYAAEASEKRIQAIEKDIEASDRRISALERAIESQVKSSGEPRHLALSRWQGAVAIIVALALVIMAGLAVYAAMGG